MASGGANGGRFGYNLWSVILKRQYKKMEDVDIDPFGEHELRPEEPTDEHIPLDPVTPGRSTWEPD